MYTSRSSAKESNKLYYLPCRPDMPTGGQGIIDEGYTRNADSPVSEDQDYLDEDNQSQRGKGVARKSPS